MNDTAANTPFHRKPVWKILIFILLVLDILAIIVFWSRNPMAANYLWIAISGVVTAALSIGKVLGWIQSNNTLTKALSFDQLMGNGYFQVFMVMFTAGVFVIGLCPDCIRPGEITVYFETRDTLYQRPVECRTVLYYGEEWEAHAGPDLPNEVFLNLDTKMYDIKIIPKDSVRYPYSTKKQLRAEKEMDNERIMVHFTPKNYPYRFNVIFSAPNAVLRISGYEEPLYHKSVFELTRGIYSYEVTAAGYHTARGTFAVPEDIHEGKLSFQQTRTNQEPKPDLISRKVIISARTRTGHIRSLSFKIRRRIGFERTYENKTVVSLPRGNYYVTPIAEVVIAGRTISVAGKTVQKSWANTDDLVIRFIVD